MKQKNYVSVCGPINSGEVWQVIYAFMEETYMAKPLSDVSYAPVIGLQVSKKTLNGGITKNLRFPPFNRLRKLVSIASEFSVPVVHYNTRDMENLYGQLEKVLEEIYSVNCCDTIQINRMWPDHKDLERIKTKYESLGIIQQVVYQNTNKEELAELVEKIMSYDGLIDYVLIDPSRGRGKGFDVDTTSRLFSEFKTADQNISVVIAGGLSGEYCPERSL